MATDNDKQNFVFCPINVQVLLAALSSADLYGHNDQSREIRQVAELPYTLAETEQYIIDLLNDLNQISDDFQLASILKLYYNNRIAIKDRYKDLLRSIYKAEVEAIDFSNVCEKSQL